MPISTYNPGQKVLGHSLFFTCFVRNLQLTGNIATSSKLSIYREWTRERAAKPLAFAAPLACCSRVTSCDSPKRSACSQTTGNTDHKYGLNKVSTLFQNKDVAHNLGKIWKRVWLVKPYTVQEEEGLTWIAIFFKWKAKCPKRFVQDCTSQVE